MSTFAANIGKLIIENARKSGRVMTEKETESAVTLMMMDRHPNKLCGLEQEMMEKHPIFAIMSHRINGGNAGKISTTARLFLAELAGGSPGNAVLFASVVAALGEGREDEITLEELMSEAFPFAVPTEKILHDAWDRQKALTVEGKYYDNALDGRWAWEGVSPV